MKNQNYIAYTARKIWYFEKKWRFLQKFKKKRCFLVKLGYV